MNFCTKCFNDIEVKALIEGNGIKGNCDFCNSKDVKIIGSDNLEIKDEIASLIKGILRLYSSESEGSVENSIEATNFSSIYNFLKNDWDIFNVSTDTIRVLINFLFQKDDILNEDIFVKPVYRPAFTDSYMVENHSIVRNFTWSYFAKNIKHAIRYHNGILNMDILKEFVDYSVFTLKKGKHLYRGRVSSNANIIAKSNMGAPPKQLASPGRANPSGISYLYLANDLPTTLLEIRAKYHDLVCVGTFDAVLDLKIVDFERISKLSPFLTVDNILFEEHLINKEFLHNMNLEMAKPLKNTDSPDNYVPIQYIAEYINILGYDGIKYKSTLSDMGYNIVVFNPKNFICTKVDNYTISGIDYKTELLEIGDNSIF